jgi:hypothetical protein
MSHTPTPWQLLERDGGGYKLADDSGEFISFLCSSRYPDDDEDPEAEANAAFIVTAVNALNELRDLLAIAVASTEAQMRADKEVEPSDWLIRARAALAKVKS